MTKHVAEHPVGEDLPDWLHLRYLDVEVGDQGSWTLHIWYRKYGTQTEWRCSRRGRNPSTHHKGYPTEYDAINAWFHLEDYIDGEQA